MRLRKQGEMARRLVYYCIGVLTATAVWAAVITTMAAVQGWMIDLNAVLTYIGAAFGGELLMLLCKRVLAKPTDPADETITTTNDDGGNG